MALFRSNIPVFSWGSDTSVQGVWGRTRSLRQSVRKTRAFTLVELVVVIAVSSVILAAITTVFPYVLSTFESQKAVLEFQKKSLVDTAYLLDKLANSKRFLKNYSSGSIQSDRNSYSFFMNTFDKQRLPFFAVGLFMKTGGSFVADSGLPGKILGIREGFLQGGFAEARGYVYFSEPGENIIRRMSFSGTSLETVYGQSGLRWSSDAWAWTFHTPTALTYDGVKYLYVADTGNHTIRRIDLDTNVVSTLAGSSGIFGYNAGETNTSGTDLGNVRLNGPMGLFASGTTLYVSDTFNNRIRKIDLSVAKAYTLAGSDLYGSNGDSFTSATGALLNYPLWIVGTPAGIAFADSVNGKVRLLNEATNTLKTLVGLDLPNQGNTYSEDVYTKLDYTTDVRYSGGYLYFNDLANGVLYRLSAWVDSILWTADDGVLKVLGDVSNDLLANGDFELSLTDPSSEIVSTAPLENVYRTTNAKGAPKSGVYYMVVDARGRYATWSMSFPSLANPADGSVFQVGGLTYEFDSDFTYTIGNTVVPRATTFSDTFENLATEMAQNPNVIVTQSGSNSFTFRARNFGATGNSLVLSGSVAWLVFAPSGWALSGGADSVAGTTAFYMDKKLVNGRQYRLSFYTKADSEILGTALAPLVEITSGGANVSYKVTRMNDSWAYHEYLFSWVNPSGNDLQRIEFLVTNGNRMYFDAIELTALGSRESDQSLSTFRVDILPTYFIRSSSVFLIDGYNRKMKLVDVSTWGISTLRDGFPLVDPFGLVLSGREDFTGNSGLEGLTFEAFSQNDLAPSKLQYSLSNGSSILKLVGNVAR